MVAPLVAVAGRTAASVGSRKEASGPVPSRQSITRSGQQNQNRILQAKESRSIGSVTRLTRAANDNYPSAANDNEEESGEANLTQAQERVNRLRFIKAQTLLAPEEEAEKQITREKEQKPSLVRYSPAFATGGFKDSLDFIAVGSLPVIGTVITFLCTVLIFIFLIFAKKNSSISDMKFIIKRLLVVLVTFIVEAFAFGPNLFPFEVASIAIVFWMDRNLSQAQIDMLQNLSSGLRKKPL